MHPPVGSAPTGLAERPCRGPGCTKLEIERLRAEQRRLQEQIAAIDRQLAEKQRALQAEAAARDGGDPEVLLVERHRLDAQRLESLGALAGGLAHQFNNLLTVIGGHVGLATAEAAPGSGLAHSLEEIRGATYRAAALCRQMLEAAGHSVAAYREIEATAVVEAALAHVARGEPDRYRLEWTPPARPLPRIRGGITQLHQALAAVIQNAFEAARLTGGVVGLTLHEVVLDASQAARVTLPVRPGRYVCFEVRDSGPGIAPDVLRRIYEPFFSTKGVGRGLGLAVASGVARAHGGGVAVESRLGLGTIFWIYLPVAPGAG